MFLIDTNCWMQVARNRSQADEVRRLLADVPTDRLFISIFSVHSIGNVMAARGWINGYAEFLTRTSIGVSVRVVSVPIPDLRRVEEACLAYRLDFDDAYQYIAAELHGLEIVSLDADFDQTPRGRLTPAAALQRLTNEQQQQGQQP